ncbi:type II toxin-antitoxin system RatA family toxin [Rhizorhabdus dicambivorans]|uniref:Ubiquinone-binding protein n=1 Tax=Rhizorhabdus dicambivorans TaxID=1850238 RepID=A0A2A4FV29_9SPHN|nr:type II toxin-antitoxin system RatA family toxin [Rhizorhabdus dicambivorans]ATE65370.1 ubiquinone-binding protein [Rhizorhabdus dicambivorans]PCE42300.1 ubiquinone-binding protein [Rhizorhabdus dicambivorans]
MPRHHEVRTLPYSPEQMYDLVADVARYGEFLPWVSAVRIRSDGPTEMVADLMVGFKALREKFTSKVTKQRPASIHVDYLDGPLKYLRNDWKFAPDGKGGTLVDFAIEFEFKSRIFEMIAGQVFDRALRMMIGAFEERAAKLYGSSASVAPGISSSSAHSAA